MQPAKLDLPTIWRGSTSLPVTITWKDGNGDPIDLSGWFAVAQSRNIDLNAQITDATNGVTTVCALEAIITSTLRVGVEQWDWVWSDPNGVIYPPTFAGMIEIKQGVAAPQIQIPDPGRNP